MKQIIQDLKKGNTILEEVPTPKIRPGQVLIRTCRTLVSLGTERMLVEFGKASYLDKAKQQPDKVKMVLDKVKTDGLKPTYESVVNKLNQPLPLGYCNVGEVVELGKGVTEFKIGDRVASNGAHAEFVCVPKNLVAKVPEGVTDDEAAFTIIGAIALQGIRLCNPTFGETIVVVGLGLIGLVTAELLKANGCKVIGFDFDEQKVKLAQEKGIIAVNLSVGTDPVNYALEFSNEVGVDAVIITATNKSDEIIHQAAEMSRKRGRIILVGVIGLDIRRDDFFKKELTFQVSASYGPGRYDDDYEQKGQDYPIGFVRWTEKRNFEAVLNAISRGQLDVKPLITERVKLENYQEIYGDMRKSGSIASIMMYNNEAKQDHTVKLNSNSFQGQRGVIGIIGAGNFTSSTLLPRLSKTKAHLKYIADLDGLLAKSLAKRFNIANAISDQQEIFQDKDVDTVMIITRHDAHADLVKETLKAGKNVFVEKPLALNQEQLNQIIETYKSPPHSNTNSPTLTLGFNRRFAPLAQKMKSLLGNSDIPMNIIATMNAGYIPPEVWVHDIEVGGGRIIGEACHFIDLCTYFSGSKVKAVCLNSLGKQPNDNTDNASILLKYENGTNAVINYFANGSKSYAKERLEVFSQQRVLIMDNWRKLKGYGFKGFKSKSTPQDKGHANQFNLFVDRVQHGGDPIIPVEEIINTTRASFAAIESLRQGKWIEIE
jgi:predicted dehydrogenase/threonine dehydrogenase-like Zn-dependent dehydrogenase